MKSKQQILKERGEELQVVCRSALAEEVSVQESLCIKKDIFSTEKGGGVQAALRVLRLEKIKELGYVADKGFFSRLVVRFDGGSKDEQIYVGVFGVREADLVSWTTSVAQIRFKDPGRFEIRTPRGKIKCGLLLSREEYLISGGKIKYLSRSTEKEEKKLIYQEHLSKKKTGFLLPEVVAKMEKLQDTVIRMDHEGGMVISGPAGSGKTTLALHRVAYLRQSPLIKHLYEKPLSCFVFVQDEKTVEYFSKLLPSLGVHDVLVVTFLSWARKVLDIHSSWALVREYGETYLERDRISFHKNTLIKKITNISWSDDYFKMLSEVYEDEDCFWWSVQKKKKILDAHDLTLVLSLYISNFGTLHRKKRAYKPGANAQGKEKYIKVPLSVSLLVVDEFENYSSIQLKVLAETLSQEGSSTMYIGDLRQQTVMSSMGSWEGMPTEISPDKHIRLEKVYRSTKEILMFLQGKGYDVSIPERLPKGSPVEEIDFISLGGLHSLASSLTKGGEVGVVVLGDDQSKITKLFSEEKNVHVLSFEEVQGVEFETTIVIDDFGWVTSSEKNTENLGDFEIKRSKIIRDRAYVALTRSLEKLIVVYSCQ